MKNFKYSLLFLSMILLLGSCSKKEVKPPYDLTETAPSSLSVPYQELRGNKTIPVKLNGVSMDMIFDTGCAGIQISLHELRTLFKNGVLEADDILGESYSSIADGSIVKNGKIRIRSLAIGGGDNQIILEDLEASVSLNQDAPLLLGNIVFDELASIEVDNIHKTINFTKK